MDTNPSAGVYANNQKTFCSGPGVVLALTEIQELILVQCYAKDRDDYRKWSNNCGGIKSASKKLLVDKEGYIKENVY